MIIISSPVFQISFYSGISESFSNEVYKLCLVFPHYIKYILREKSLAIYFEDSQFIRIKTFNFIVSKIYVDKRSRVR